MPHRYYYTQAMTKSFTFFKNKMKNSMWSRDEYHYRGEDGN